MAVRPADLSRVHLPMFCYQGKSGVARPATRPAPSAGQHQERDRGEQAMGTVTRSIVPDPLWTG